MLFMPSAGFTPLSVFSLVTCQLYCKAKHHWEDTVYKTSPTWGTYLFSKLWQDPTQRSARRFRNFGVTGSCYLHLQTALGQITPNGQRGCPEAEQRYVSTVLPVSFLWAPVCQDKPIKTVGFEYEVICLLYTDHQSSFPAQHLYCHNAFSKRSHTHTWLYSILLASLPQHL